MKKKNYLILGSTSGIGLQLTKNFIKNNLLYCVGRDFSQLDKYVKKNSLKKNYVKIKVDFLKNDYTKIFKKVKKIDVIFVCVGYTKLRLIKYFSAKEFESILNVNLIKPLKIIAELYSKDLINYNGSIVVLSSLVSFGAMKGSFNYAVSKSALNGAIKGMAKEFAEKNINVNGVAPAMVETPLIKKTKQIQGKYINEEKKKYLIGKKYLSIIEVTNLIMFLSSKKSKKITGQIVIIDGGYSLN